MSLNGKQRRHLRGLGHHLDPAVHIGKAGLTGAVVEAIAAALLAHELIKVRRSAECPLERKELADAIGQATGADVAQVLGRNILLYRAHPEKPSIRLPVD